MPKLYVTTREGKEKSVEAEVGESVMVILRDNGFEEVLALCGGCCSCGTCHVHVDPQMMKLLPEMSEDENSLLEGSAHRTACSRLSCQISFTQAQDGLRVTIAKSDWE